MEEIRSSIAGDGDSKIIGNGKLNKIVVGHIQEEINRLIGELCLDKNPGALCELLTDALQLAKALEVAPEIINQLSELQTADISDVFLGKYQSDPSLGELISRTFLIREIIKNTKSTDAEGATSLLQQLRSSPYSIRSNKCFIDVFRKSGSLVSEGRKWSEKEPEPLQSSHELPSQVLFNDNPLVIEDYLMKRKTKTRDALVIIKDTYKAVVPRHMSHAVLTGKCSYTLLDEHGIRHFEPLNVLEAMAVLKRMPAIKKRFSTYQHCRIEADAQNMNGSGGRSASEEAENKIADSEDIDGILALASSCNTFGRMRLDSSSAHHHGGGIFHTAYLPKVYF